jgi:Putative threonine efflux protein
MAAHPCPMHGYPMTSVAAFVSSIVVLLAVPGPTNSLLFLSGAELGFRRSLRLIAGETAGYLAVVVPLATAAAPLFENTLAASFAKLAAAAWIMYLAAKLWRRGTTAPGVSSVTVGGLFVTTLLNPKALVIGLTIMPSGSPAEIAPWVFLFTGLLIMIAVCWIGAGAAAVLAARGRFDPSRMLSRTAAIVLAAFSLFMITSIAGIAWR